MRRRACCSRSDQMLDLQRRGALSAEENDAPKSSACRRQSSAHPARPRCYRAPAMRATPRLRCL